MIVKVSIIVPVYNVEAYLSQCVDSLLNQTLDGVEIILVNDGSKDNSGEICDKYQSLHANVTVIHQENQGVAKARERGTLSAKGIYTFYVDSDDWLEPDACELMYNSAIKLDADLVSIGYFKEYQNKTLVAKPLGYDHVFSGPEGYSNYLGRLVGLTGKQLRHPHKFDAFSSMKKLYRREIILKNKVHFIDAKEIFPGEDTYFNINFAFFGKVFIHIEKPLYHYRRELDESATGGYKIGYFDKWEHRYSVYTDLLQKLKIENEFQEELNNRICTEFISLALKESNPANPKSIPERIRFINSKLNSSFYKSAFKRFNVDVMPIHWKLFFLFCKRRFGAGVYAMALAMRSIRSKV